MKSGSYQRNQFNRGKTDLNQVRRRAAGMLLAAAAIPTLSGLTHSDGIRPALSSNQPMRASVGSSEAVGHRADIIQDIIDAINGIVGTTGTGGSGTPPAGDPKP